MCGYKHDQIAVQSVRIPVSATRFVDLVGLVLLSASLTTLAFLMSVSLRNLSVSYYRTPTYQVVYHLNSNCTALSLMVRILFM